MTSFIMNGYLWHVKFVSPTSHLLIDRTNHQRVATTDPKTHCVYLSSDLDGDFLITVLLHELGHCVIISYDLLYDIHAAVHPAYWIEAEEWICNFIADYGRQIFAAASDILGDEVWAFIPYELDRLIA